MTRRPVSPPPPSEYGEFYNRYVELAVGDDIRSRLTTQLGEFADFVAAVRTEHEGFRYADGKWSVREVLGHVVDADRVFGYRALSFARGSDRPLPGFDEKVWATQSGAGARRLADLFAEFELVRRSHLALFENLPDEAWERIGEANGQPVSVRALAYIMVGHAAHHLAVLRERYAAALQA